MTDLLHRLSAARPGEDELAGLWSPQERADLLSRILATSVTDVGAEAPAQETGSKPRRPWHRMAWVGAAAATMVVVALPAGLGTQDATAADLRVLALNAASYDGSVLGEGRWLHERSTSLQRNSPTLGDGAVHDLRRETWTRWDGRVLLIERSAPEGWTTYDVIDGAHAIDDVDAPAFDDPDGYQEPTPRFAATLPDDAADLLAYLDGRVFGDSSHEEALFSALVGLATSHTLPPAVLAATFDALAQVEGVRTDDVLVQGDPAVEISFRDDVTSSTESITVDRATGQVLSMSNRSAYAEYTSTTTLSEVVDEVPADVLADFEQHREGVRYDAAG